MTLYIIAIAFTTQHACTAYAASQDIYGGPVCVGLAEHVETYAPVTSIRPRARNDQ